MFTAILHHFQQLQMEEIAAERKTVLAPLVTYIQNKRSLQLPVKLNFICTHNSRRSQLAQVLAQAIAHSYQIEVKCFSGGTEATAFNQQAVKALEEMGFRIKQKGSDNPIYQCYFSNEHPPVEAFSKKFDHSINPTRDFAAIMTCSEADKNCPFIPGAALRIPIRYQDPKVYDGTPQASEQYEATAQLIAKEMLYVFSQIAAS